MLRVWLHLFTAILFLGVWWRSHSVTHVLSIRAGRHGLALTVSSGQFRAYLRREADERTYRVRLWRHRFRTFGFDRTRFDTTYLACGNFLYARGRNTESGVRYRVASIPILLPGVLAQLAAALSRDGFGGMRGGRGWKWQLKGCAMRDYVSRAPTLGTATLRAAASGLGLPEAFPFFTQ